MSKYKIGDPLHIHGKHSDCKWYSDELFYVKRIIPSSLSRTNVELLECISVTGKELIAHETKFYLDIESSREYKLSSILK